MTINYPIRIPVYEFAEISWAPLSVVANPRSAFTGKGQIQVLEGQWWEGQVTFPQLPVELASSLTGFLTALNGREGTFLLGDPSHQKPQGQAKDNASSPLINGAGQIGNQISIRNGPVAVTGWLAQGDLLQLGAEGTASLHKVTKSTDTDASGLATIDIWPRLRKSPVDGAGIILEGAQGLFRLNQDGASWSVSPPTQHDSGFACIEAF